MNREATTTFLAEFHTPTHIITCMLGKRARNFQFSYVVWSVHGGEDFGVALFEEGRAISLLKHPQLAL